ncbi:MAG: hypothetical protein H6728_16680 [Myxococcales bacterium]|nr:hypothetical protein [Myxococcales bacterium]
MIRRPLMYGLFFFSLCVALVLPACVCTPPTFNSSCSSDADCIASMRCDFNTLRCVPRNVNPTCTTDADCLSGQACVVGQCIAQSCQTGETISCVLGGQTGPCSVGERTCRNGVWSSCEPKNATGTQETCNGVDDDCDGQVDEDFKGKFETCEVVGKQGPCRLGIQSRCIGGQIQCESTYNPISESIGSANCDDNVDNDCNGLTDKDDPKCQSTTCKAGETRSCYEGPPGTEGIGACALGTQSCVGGTFGPCQGQVLPTKEICNNRIDEDCNGLADDKCNETCTSGQSRECYSGAESTRNVGICKAGNQLCINGTWSECQGEVLPTKEICDDKLDNDCNGKIDDCLTPGECTPGDARECYTAPNGCTLGASGFYTCQGACKAGKQSCGMDGKWAACQNDVGPTTEICNDNIDNDCDGKVDGCAARDELLSASWDNISPIKMWDTNTPKELKNFTGGHTDIAYSVRASKDGRFMVTGGQDKRVILWNLATSAPVWSATDHNTTVYSTAIDSAGKVIASGAADGKVFLWNPITGKVDRRLTANSGGVYALDIDPTGRWLASGGADAQVQLRDLSAANPNAVSILTGGHSLDIYAVAIDPQARWIVSGGRDAKPVVWDIPNAKLLYSLAGPSQGITSIAFSADGNTLAVGSSDYSILLFDMTKTPPAPAGTLKIPNNDPVYSLAFHPLGKILASGTYGNNIVLWDLSTKTIQSTITNAHNGAVSSLSFRP